MAATHHIEDSDRIRKWLLWLCLSSLETHDGKFDRLCHDVTALRNQVCRDGPGTFASKQIPQPRPALFEHRNVVVVVVVVAAAAAGCHFIVEAVLLHCPDMRHDGSKHFDRMLFVAVAGISGEGQPCRGVLKRTS
jgi:hypothetical protein